MLSQVLGLETIALLGSIRLCRTPTTPHGERQAHRRRRRHAGHRLRRLHRRRRDRGRPRRGHRRAGRPKRRRRADRRLRPGGAARRHRHARPLRGSRPPRAGGLHHRHHVGRGRWDDHRDRAPAHLPAGDHRPALPRETGDGEAEGGHRLRPVGCADRALDPRDQGSVGRGSGRLQGLHADLRPLLPPRHGRRIPGGHARGEDRWRPRARPRRERLAAAGWPCADAVHRALYLAAHADVRIQIVHVSSPVSAELAAGEKRRGRPVTMEICPHHLLLDLDDLVRLGPYGMCAPALRDRALVERLWSFVLDGTADCLISDHSAYTLEEKEPGWDNIFDALLGCQVIQETVPLVLDEAYHRRGMPLDAFARFSSTNPARIAGLYPRKGTLVPGSDADVALYDLETEWTVDARSQQFSKNPWSPFDGRRVRAGVTRTLVRGETVYADGEILAEPGSGRFLSCQEDHSLGGQRTAAAG